MRKFRLCKLSLSIAAVIKSQHHTPQLGNLLGRPGVCADGQGQKQQLWHCNSSLLSYCVNVIIVIVLFAVHR